MVSILGIGDNVVDIYVDKNMMYPGGNSLNIAVLAKRYGAHTAYIGCIGNDKSGELVYSSLKEEGVDVSHIKVLAGSNAYAKVNLIDGDRVFVGSDKGVSQKIQFNDDDISFIKKFQLIHTSIYSGLENYLENIKKLGPKISFDFSDEYNMEYLEKTLPYIDYAFFSGSRKTKEEIEVFQRKVSRMGPELTLVTRGSNGASLYYENKHYEQPAIPTKVIDTLGAGDAFISRLLLGVMNKENIKLALNNSAKEAAKVCGYYGAYGYGVKI